MSRQTDPFVPLLEEALEASLAAKRATLASEGGRLVALAREMAEVFRGGGRVFFFGNGGSAADAQHLAAEFVNRFRMERRPLPGIALTTDTSILTAVGNDYSFDDVFAKQVQALGRPGDMAVGISTSGHSPNVVKALAAAREAGLRTVALTGRGGGRMAETADLVLRAASDDTPRIQEVQIFLGHLLCDLVERILFAAP
ncbi:D-sedoheptulose 7-phosphate isomerase [Dissulfurirhabdus thermomarina]|uniref:Phosphoheptose isomerase n=1 Tax=Dissulfurirhabdus thermomarina TaxID=1765737 RepID=A0A6N9TQ89_DISTH|nr:D-sedoheptulose 7-phosphate isomerase [Dissulfurirhabdus thermomarina]NDY43218.1 D-sedoheptulose 7-phosphate isomerase [Dissulfurirhabdus thermomarina]NMX23219.1 D-sedoheptulose 7-phosphate isomerase [Dissulfurirhabdus thermomarina]